MALTTYITSAEATLLYDDATYTDASAKALALSMSFGLVNSYLNSALNVPIIPEWNGSDATIAAPAPLKLAQAKAYEYLLRRGEVGDTPDVAAVFDEFKEFCVAITQEELTLPESTTFEREVGWHIVGKSNAGGGHVYVRGGLPALNQHVKLVITNAASATYAGTFTYTLYEPGRSASAISTGNVTSFDWLDVAALTDGNRPFQIRWEGKWTNADYVEIRGVAPDMVDSTPPARGTIQQSPVAY